MNNNDLKELKDYLSCSSGFKRLAKATLILTILMGITSLTLLGVCIYTLYTL